MPAQPRKARVITIGVQRFGDNLNLDLHVQSLVLDGVYETNPDSDPRREG